MNWLQVGVQWLHVLLGIVWFGYALSIYFLVSPPLMKLPEAQQRDIFVRLGAVGPKVFPIVAILVVVLGFVRGTFLGRIQSLEDLATTYGILFTVGLLGTLLLFFTGARFIRPAFENIGSAHDFAAASARLRAVTRIDLVIFFIVFTCMILMRFN
jgi:uncharacterized membrane protein